jgi:hypothetical protein
MKPENARRVAAAVVLDHLREELAHENLDPHEVTFSVDREQGISAAEARDAFDRALEQAHRAFHPEGPILSRVARALDFTPHALHRCFGFLQKPIRWLKKLAVMAADAITSKEKPRISDGALAAAAAVTGDDGKKRPLEVAKDAVMLPIRTAKGVLMWRPEDVKSKHVVEARLPNGEVRKMTVEVDDLALSIWLLRTSANACAIGGIPFPGSGAVSFLAAAIASGALAVNRLQRGDLQGAKACALTTAKVGALSAAIGIPIVAAYQQSQDLWHAAHSGLAIGLVSDGLILTLANSLGTRLEEIEEKVVNGDATA